MRFIEGGTALFNASRFGKPQQFESDPNFYNSLTEQGRVAYDQAEVYVARVTDDASRAYAQLELLESQGQYLNETAVYALHNPGQFYNPSESMMYYMSAHPYFTRAWMKHGDGYEVMSDEFVNNSAGVLYNAVLDGALISEGDTEAFVFTTDDERDLGFRKLKGKDRGRLQATYEYLDELEAHKYKVNKLIYSEDD